MGNGTRSLTSHGKINRWFGAVCWLLATNAESKSLSLSLPVFLSSPSPYLFAIWRFYSFIRSFAKRAWHPPVFRVADSYMYVANVAPNTHTSAPSLLLIHRCSAIAFGPKRRCMFLLFANHIFVHIMEIEIFRIILFEISFHSFRFFRIPLRECSVYRWVYELSIIYLLEVEAQKCIPFIAFIYPAHAFGSFAIPFVANRNERASRTNGNIRSAAYYFFLRFLFFFFRFCFFFVLVSLCVWCSVEKASSSEMLFRICVPYPLGAFNAMSMAFICVWARARRARSFFAAFLLHNSSNCGAAAWLWWIEREGAHWYNQNNKRKNFCMNISRSTKASLHNVYKHSESDDIGIRHGSEYIKQINARPMVNR